MWLVRSVRGDENVDIQIAIGQFAIDDKVFSPKNDFSQTPWQDGKSAFDLNCLSGVDWYSWSNIYFHIDGSELGDLFELLDCSWSQAIEEKRRFILRDGKKKARSRWAYLIDVTWQKKEWKINASFCDDTETTETCRH